MVSQDELKNVLQVAEGLTRLLSGVENVDKIMETVHHAYQAEKVSRMEDQIANLLVARIYQGCAGDIVLEDSCQSCGRPHDVVVSSRGLVVVNEVKRIEPECFGGQAQYLLKTKKNRLREVKDRENTKGALERLLNDDIPEKCKQLHQGVPGVVWIISKNASIMRTHVEDAAKEIQKRIRDEKEDRYRQLTAVGWLLDAVTTYRFSEKGTLEQSSSQSHCFLIRPSPILADVLRQIGVCVSIWQEPVA